jgi:hypothetical protein
LFKLTTEDPMSDVIDLLNGREVATVERAELSTRAQLLDAIDRELASMATGYAEHALRLAEAYARVTSARS